VLQCDAYKGRTGGLFTAKRDSDAARAAAAPASLPR